MHTFGVTRERFLQACERLFDAKLETGSPTSSVIIGCPHRPVAVLTLSTDERILDRELLRAYAMQAIIGPGAVEQIELDREAPTGPSAN